MNYPKISIITPSYNQGDYLEETILSVLDQNYPNLEYIIIDGGSTDNSVEIIKKYQDRITYWVSEKDEGQSHAICKGLLRATGDWFNWINSDDYLAKGALHALAEEGDGYDIFAGGVFNFDNYSEIFIQNKNLSAAGFFSKKNQPVYQQPGFWFKTKYLSSVSINQNLNYCFDLDLTIQILIQNPIIKYTSKPLAHFRLHPDSKTVKSYILFEKERYQIAVFYKNVKDDSKLKRNAGEYVRIKDWWNYLENLTHSNKSKMIKIYLIIVNVFSDFSLRFNRLSLGYIKNILIK